MPRRLRTVECGDAAAKQKNTKNSQFRVGIYGENWAKEGKEMGELAKQLEGINPNKRRFYQRGLKAQQYILSLS